MANLIKLSTADKKAIKAELLAEMTLKNNKANTQGNLADEEIIDPIVEACDQKMIELLKSLPIGTLTVRGRSGSTTINRTEESLNTIKEILQNRMHRRTRSFSR